MKSKQFSSGDQMPALGLGTWKSATGKVYEAVRTAIRTGYRHIDCAPVYENEQEIGQALHDAISEGDVAREDLWITSKLWNSSHKEELVTRALVKTLKDLQLDYLDLYLIHWPVVFKEGVIFPSTVEDFIPLELEPIANTWKGMEACSEKGLARNLGVCNFSARKIADLLNNCNKRPEVNQVEMHPFLQQQELVDYCQQEKIYITAYSPLGSPDRPDSIKKSNEPSLLGHPVINDVASDLGYSPGQVLIAWAIQRGTIVIPKSTNAGRIAENFKAASMVLEEKHMASINRLDRHYRYVDGTFFTPENSPYSLSGLWDE